MALLAICTLSACQRTSADEAVFEVATEHAAMPDCASLHLDWAWQQREDNHYLLGAQFIATESCMDLWDRNLANSEFEARAPHGEWVKSGKPGMIVTSAFDGIRRGVLLVISEPIADVSIIEASGAL